MTSEVQRARIATAAGTTSETIDSGEGWSTPTSGNHLVLLITFRGFSVSVTLPSGFTPQQDNSGTAERRIIATKTSDGTESSLTVGFDGVVEVGITAIEVSGASGFVTAAATKATGATSISTGSADHDGTADRAYALVHVEDADVTASLACTGYTVDDVSVASGDHTHGVGTRTSGLSDPESSTWSWTGPLDATAAIIVFEAAPASVDLDATPTAVDVASAPATFETALIVDGLHPTAVDVAVAPASFELSPTPPKFAGAARPTLAELVRRSHQVARQVLIRDPATGDELELKVLGGKVTIDRTRDVRRTVEATLTDPTGTLTPGQATDLLSPFGNELIVRRGVVHTDGAVELADLGVFRLDDFDVDDGTGGLTIKLSGSDRSVVVQRAGWESRYVIAAGTAVEDAIAALLTDRYPGVTVNLPAMGATTPQVVLDGSEGDPWRDAAGLARAAGWELHFDASGEVVATRPATPAGTPAYTYQDGAEAVLLDLKRGVSTAASVYNGVIATAEGTHLAAPLRSVVWDTDSGSPTYYLGKFGRVPRRWSTPLATTQGQLDAAAQSLLDGILGANEDIAFTQIVNPLLDVNTVIEVTRERAGLEAVRVVLDVVEIPLAADQPQSASGRRRFL